MVSQHTSEKKEIGDQTIVIDPVDPDSEFGGSEERRRLERKLLWRIDCRMFILVVIYILHYIDRNNVAAARLRGFESDLQLKNQDYNTVLSISYVGYLLMQVPSNMFLNYIGRPSIYLPACMMLWGSISILTGITTNFAGALLARFFLGFAETAFFPGALFLLSKWYTRNELGLRICILYCGNIIANAFGTLLASGILDGMQGKLGREAWRWLFFIEGSLTIAVASAALFIMPDFPENTRWLTPPERSLALRRMEKDGGINIDDQEEDDTTPRNVQDVDESASRRVMRLGSLTRRGRGFWLAVSDWKVWWLAITFTAQVTALSFNAFFPTLGATLGFGRTITLIIVAPPWIIAAIAAFFVSRHSDKRGEHFFHIIGPLLVGMLGSVIAMSTMNIAARYISLCLMSLTYCGFIVMFTWVSNSIPRPPSKRAVALALINCVSQSGNIAGSYVWPTKWGPSYRNSYGICVSLQGLTIVMCWFFRRHLQSLNRKLENSEQRRDSQQRGFRYLI